MKKALIVLLALVFVLSAVLLVACNKTEVKITLKNVPESVSFGATVDYSKISLEVEYDNGRTNQVKLTADGVTHSDINTYQAGVQTLTAHYKGLTAQADVEVLFDVDAAEITVMNVRNTEGYREYEAAKGFVGSTAEEKEMEFYNRDALYTVGNDNGYVALPDITWRYKGETMPASLPVVESTFTLSLKNGGGWDALSGSQLETYLAKVVDNVYYFTKEAEGKTFKLDVAISNDYVLISQNVPKTISQQFEVVNGYNVYDAWGLSVLDNRNVKSWAEIKTRKLAWDDGKALSEFADVEQIVLHNNIEVTVDNLPDNYFWHKGDEAKRVGSMSYNTAEQLVPATLKEYLPGSLKEAWLGEAWENEDKDGEQRGLYVSNGIGISGNYLKLSYDSNLDAADKASKGIYIVHDYKQTTTATNRQYPESHYSFVVYTHSDPNFSSNEEAEAAIKGTRTIKNVYFKGETQKTDDVSTPVGIMMLSADISGLQIVNTISTQWYCNAQLDGVGMGSLKLQDCKFYESFSQMVFCWGIPTIDVTNCEMKRAGGPLFIIQTQTNGKDRNSNVTIDSVSNMESWLTGAETWFDINNLPAATIETLFDYGTKSDGSVNTHYKKDGKVNVIAVVIPDPGDVFKNQEAIPGTINIGETVYSMDDPIYKAVIALNAISEQGSTLADNTLKAIGTNASVSALKSGFEGLALSPVMPIYKCGTNYGYFDGKKFNLLSNLQQLYGGSLQVQQTLNANADSYESANPTVAAQLRALATQWGNLANTANLKTVGTYAGATSQWNAGHLAFWINPGGLNPKQPDLKLKHFMVLFGESAAA